MRDICLVFTFLAIMEGGEAAINILAQIFMWTCIFICLGYIPRNGIAGSCDNGGASQDEGMATHSSFLAWRISWTEEAGRLQSIGLQRVGHP